MLNIKNNKMLTNAFRSLGTRLGVSNLKVNKLQYSYNIRVLTTV